MKVYNQINKLANEGFKVAALGNEQIKFNAHDLLDNMYNDEMGITSSNTAHIEYIDTLYSLHVPDSIGGSHDV
jgi:hypothetical protein